MYPFLDVLGTQIHMTGLGIIIFVAVFLWGIRSYGKQYGLSTDLFIKYVPLYILCIYLFGTYFWYLIEEGIFFPLNLEQLMRYISPYEYSFHLIGIVVGSRISLRHFFSQMKDKNKIIKRVDVFFLSAMIGTVPFGIFLLLGDSFIGSPIDTGFYISALQPESKVATYDTVIPLGLYVSFTAMLLYVITKIIRVKIPNIRGYGFYGRTLFIFLICLIILFQEYPRRLVISFLGKTRDIKNYTLIFVCGLLIREYKKTYSFFSNVDSYLPKSFSTLFSKNISNNTPKGGSGN